MERQQSRRSLLILVAVAIVVVGVVVAKTVPKEEAAPARPTPADHPVRQSAAVPEDPTRHGADEEALGQQALEERQEQVAPEVEEEDASPAPVVPRPPAKPEPKEPSSEPEPSRPPAVAAEAAEPPMEAEPAAPEPAQLGQEEPVELLPGSKLEEALTNGQPTMADFGAGWCQACKMMDPVLKQAARKYEGKADIVYVDTDKFPQMARDYKIRAIPTQIFFDAAGQEVNRHMGYWPIEEIDKQFAALGDGE
jgi:thioredoxin 1